MTMKKAVLFFLYFVPFALHAAAPDLEFGDAGVAGLSWGQEEFVGQQGFAVKRIVFEKGEPDGPPGGHVYSDADVSSPRIMVNPGEKNITHHYPWGLASLQHTVNDDRLDLTLTLKNTSEYTVADFEVRLMELALQERDNELKNGLVYLTMDRPVSLNVQNGNAACYITCDPFDPPVQFGLTKERTFRRQYDTYRGHSLIVQGGAPALQGESAVFPDLGVPRIAAGESLSLHFTLRFAPTNASKAVVLKPYYDAFRKARKPGEVWADRRPIGKLVIPGSPMRVTPSNPRGWFNMPKLDIADEEGRATLNEKLMEFADQAIANLRAVDAQGVIVWNIEGGHSFPDVPYGDPRRLPDIAPEMDDLADPFFARFREAGFEVGVTVRPSMVFYSEDRGRWTHGQGEYDPEHESFKRPLTNVSEQDIKAQRVYPVAERLSAKITYAKERWGCKLFYIHDNGFWWRADSTRPYEWLLVSSKVLGRVREQHPDVLLIPAYSEQGIRSVRASEYLRPLHATRGRTREEPHPLATTLRGYDDWRIDGLKTPDWLVGNAFMIRHGYRTGVSSRRAVPSPLHILREGYWAHGAPYVEIKLKREIKEYLMTLDQHTSYSEEKAVEAAEKEVPWETTPSAIREWMPEAFSISDVSGAKVQERQSELIHAGAWGDVLMWNVKRAPEDVASVAQTSGTKQRRFQGLAEELGLISPEPGAPLTPLSLIWRRGKTLDPGQLLAEDSVPPALRIRILQAPDGRRAILMVAWFGSPGRTIRLKPDLPGAGLPPGPRNLWQLPEGATLGGGDEIRITPDPVADITAVLVETEVDTPITAPPGVLLGATFDNGVDPELGGRAPRRGGQTNAPDAGRMRDGSLVLGDGQAVPFNIVPRWFSGAVEFDLKMPAAPDKPIRIFELRHHADLTLTYERRNGEAGFSVQVDEEPIPVKVYKEKSSRRRGRKNKREPREKELPPPEPFEWRTFVPIPSAGGEWRHLVMTWEIGQYALYLDGRRIAALEAAAKLRRRDGTILEPGLVLGGGENQTRQTLLLDNLFVYDWAPTPEAVAGRATASAKQPLVGEASPQTAAVWLWGRFPKGAQVGVNFRNNPNWNKVEKFRVTLFERLGGGRQQVGQVDLGAYGGVAAGDIPYNPQKEIISGGGLKMEEGLDALDSGGGGDSIGSGLMGGDEVDDMLSEMDESMGKGTQYSLEIKPMPEDSGVPVQSINFPAHRAGINKHRW